jgi:valyl-tRNA synthetase
MSDKEMPKAYNPKLYEEEIYTAWDKSGFFNPDNLETDGKPFVVSMPPPNVTGILHLGHALENSLMDAMVRYQRMKGKKALLVPGTDHAAIATQAKVEKLLKKDGMKNPREELGRDGLLTKIREYSDESMSTILNQIKKMGTSCDWSRLAYTFDESRSSAVNSLFEKMFKDGLIYRGYRVINWTVKGQSTCSEDELVYVDQKTSVHTFKYSKDFPIEIATTRPETKLGDTAVAVHPEDDRYKKYIGEKFTVEVGAEKPLVISIIADENVDPEYGTGAVGVTPAHSKVDYAMYQANKEIGIIQVIGKDGLMTKEAGKDYEGLSTLDAREKFVAWLKAEGLHIKEEEIEHNVGTSDRYKDVVEAIPMEQWFVDVNKEIPGKGKSLKDLSKEMLTTGLNGDDKQKVNVVPERFGKLVLDRIDNLYDWNISRQIWWGHRIPIWYKGDETVVSETSPGEDYTQDEDTLDTWFSSGTWTFSTLGWPEDSEDMKKYHPTDWMQMGYEIIYLWLLRMVLMSAFTLDEIPFKDCYVHGMLRDKNGNKFSKSADNGIDPLEMIEEYGTDALRVSLLKGVTAGNDSKFYTEKVEGARNFVNKLWNISRYVSSSVEEVRVVEGVEPKTLADKWILSRLDSTVESVSENMDKANFSSALERIQEFTRDDFADWYLEISKVEKGKDEILLYILQTLLKLSHPFMPFVTEQIWKSFDGEKFLMVSSWPEVKSKTNNKEIEKQFDLLKEVVSSIRNLRAEYKVEPKKKISVQVMNGESLATEEESIKFLSGAQSVQHVSEKPGEGFAAVIAGDVQVFVSLEGLVDKDKEKVRLEKEIKETEKYLVQLESKLENKSFINNAPKDVVDSIEEKKKEFNNKLEALNSQIKSL